LNPFTARPGPKASWASPQPLVRYEQPERRLASMEQHGITFLIVILSMLTHYL
jgi:hypothetical protein